MDGRLCPVPRITTVIDLRRDRVGQRGTSDAATDATAGFRKPQFIELRGCPAHCPAHRSISGPLPPGVGHQVQWAELVQAEDDFGLALLGYDLAVGDRVEVLDAGLLGRVLGVA